MLGNAWEWTEDCFVATYAGARSDGSARRDANCTYRPFRGGSLSSLAYNFRAAQRATGAIPKNYVEDHNEYRADYLGFRVLRELD